MSERNASSSEPSKACFPGGPMGKSERGLPNAPTTEETVYLPPAPTNFLHSLDVSMVHASSLLFAALCDIAKSREKDNDFREWIHRVTR